MLVCKKFISLESLALISTTTMHVANFWFEIKDKSWRALVYYSTFHRFTLSTENRSWHSLKKQMAPLVWLIRFSEFYWSHWRGARDCQNFQDDERVLSLEFKLFSLCAGNFFAPFCGFLHRLKFRRSTSILFISNIYGVLQIPRLIARTSCCAAVSLT